MFLEDLGSLRNISAFGRPRAADSWGRWGFLLPRCEKGHPLWVGAAGGTLLGTAGRIRPVPSGLLLLRAGLTVLGPGPVPVTSPSPGLQKGGSDARRLFRCCRASWPRTASSERGFYPRYISHGYVRGQNGK